MWRRGPSSALHHRKQGTHGSLTDISLHYKTGLWSCIPPFSTFSFLLLSLVPESPWTKIALPSVMALQSGSNTEWTNELVAIMTPRRLHESSEILRLFTRCFHEQVRMLHVWRWYRNRHVQCTHVEDTSTSRRELRRLASQQKKRWKSGEVSRRHLLDPATWIGPASKACRISI